MNKKDIFIIFGPPGSGKTAQADLLAKQLSLYHISWGKISRQKKGKEMFESNSKSDLEESKQNAKAIEKQFKKAAKLKGNKGVVLEGFPRRLEEAKLLLGIISKNNYQIKCLIRINPLLSNCLDRFKYRLVCPKCGTSYDNSLITSKKDICDLDGSKLKRENIDPNLIKVDFLNYMREAKEAFNHLAGKSFCYFDVTGNDDDILIFSNVLLKLKQGIKQDRKIYQKLTSSKMETVFGNFKIITYQSRVDYSYHIALVKGAVRRERGVLVRVHSSCITGDIFHSLKCDCGFQLAEAMKRISKTGKGIIIYLFQEGRGINIINKIGAYDLQNKGLDTVEANEELGFPPDTREYAAAKEILNDLGVESIRLMTNNPDKSNKLTDEGIVIEETVSLEIDPLKENKRYLRTKKDRMGHKLIKV